MARRSIASVAEAEKGAQWETRVESLLEKTVWVSDSHSVMSDSLWPHGLYPTMLLCLWNPPFSREWVAIPFSRGSFWPRDWTHLSNNLGGSFTIRTTCMYIYVWASQAALVVKNLHANVWDIRDVGSIPGLEDPLEEGMVTHPSILAWRVPWTGQPGGLQSMGSQTRLGD